MRAHQRAPVGPLAIFIESLWSYEGRFEHRLERLLPSAGIQLLVNLDEDETRTYHGADYRVVQRHAGAVVTGPHAAHFGIDTAEQRDIVGVNFRIGGATPFVSVSAAVLFGRHVDLEDLWDRAAVTRLRERLLDAASPELRLRVLEDELAGRLSLGAALDPVVVGAAEALDSEAPVADVLARVGMARKRFVARFREAVGLAPKRFARVRRFHRVLRAARRARAVDWAALAADCGYYDQAHLIRDFREFSGLTPAVYRPRDVADITHVPIFSNPGADDPGKQGP